MQADVYSKFFFLRNIQDFLLGAGFGARITDTILFLTAVAILILLIWLLNYAGSRIISTVISTVVKRSATQWDDYLFRRKFYHRLIQFTVAAILVGTTNIIFRGFSPELLNVIRLLINMYMIFVGVQLVGAFLNTINDIYETKPQSKYKSIRSIIQAAKILAWVIAGILVISLLIDKKPGDLLVAIGASAAIVSLIFRDTILGFIASIQVSAQDLIHPDDWIEMPAKGVNGRVIEINVMNVKVRNWDNSVSMIPIYSLVSETFTNWEQMLESGGRRFMRPLLIDANSIATLSEEQVAQIGSHPLIAPGTAARMMHLYKGDNSNLFTTNLGLYRCYIEAFLHDHPKIAQNLLRVVRYLPNNENGVTLELYAYATEKTLLEYERVISDIFDNIMVIASVFSLRLFQRPASPAPGSDPLAAALAVADSAGDETGGR